MRATDREPKPPDPQGACPICRAPVDAANRFQPFCRERCKMVDLGRWFRGEYAVAGEAAIAFDLDLEHGDDGGDPGHQD